MEIRLKTAKEEDAQRLNEMQRRSFLPLLNKYGDSDTNPACESVVRTLERIASPSTQCHIILADGLYAGMVTVKALGGGAYRLGPVFVLPEFQNRGAAQAALRLIETMYADAEVWRLSSIREEARSCHLYEKLGFTKTGNERRISANMTIAEYERRKTK